MPEVQGGENLLFLTDEQLRQGIEAMFFAYRGFTAAPALLNSSLKVVPIETLSKTASTATFANRFCSFKEMPNFSKVLSNTKQLILISPGGILHMII